jgi:hypothetical protein
MCDRGRRKDENRCQDHCATARAAHHPLNDQAECEKTSTWHLLAAYLVAQHLKPIRL